MTQQAFFDFLARPFQAAPQDGLFVPLEPMADAISQLCEAAVKGDGIGVLTAAPGAGKTVVCQQVQARLAGEFATVLLPSCRFPTRRAMLQSILHSMGCEYTGLSEQEALLKLLDTVESVLPERQGLVLIADEAHQLSSRLLEELRCFTNHVEQGQPLIRVLLSGQLALEELLTRPELHALNYRITCHTTLEPLSMQQSARYIDERLARVGGDACSLFGDDALEMVCRISDGNPRCLNQLADACLTKAAETGQRTVDARMVRLVLQDLKQLPLQWNESACDQLDEDDPISLASPLSMAEDDISSHDEDQTPLVTESEFLIREPFEEDRAATSALAEEPAWSGGVVMIEVGGEDKLGSGADSSEPTADDRSGSDCDDGHRRPEMSDGETPIERSPGELMDEESTSIIDFGAAPEEAILESADIVPAEAAETDRGMTGTMDEKRSLLPSLEVTMPLASARPSAENDDRGGCGQAVLRPGSGQLEELDIFDRYAALDRKTEAAQRFDEANETALGLDWADGSAGPAQAPPSHDSSAGRLLDPPESGSPSRSPLENIEHVIQAVSDAVATELARDGGLSPAGLSDEEAHRGGQPLGSLPPGPQPVEKQEPDDDSQKDLRAPRWRATPDPSAFDMIEPGSCDRPDDGELEIPTPQNPTLSQPAVSHPAIITEIPTDDVSDTEPMFGLGELPGESNDATESLQQALDALLAEQQQESEAVRNRHRVDQPGGATAPGGRRERPYARLFSRARRVRSRT